MPIRIFIDLDGVVVDFDAYMRASALTAAAIKQQPGAYLAMEPIPGAIAAVRALIARNYEVWIATKPPTGVAHAYGDKAAWVLKHLPELATRIVITHDKGFLGDKDDFLIDDRPHKANCDQFAGTFIPFTGGQTWEGVLALLPGASLHSLQRSSPAQATLDDGSGARSAGMSDTELLETLSAKYSGARLGLEGEGLERYEGGDLVLELVARFKAQERRVQSQTRESAALKLELSPSAIRLMAGEMPAQEMRTVTAVLRGIAADFRRDRA